MSLVDTTSTVGTSPGTVSRFNDFLTDRYAEELRRFPDAPGNSFLIEWPALQQWDAQVAEEVEQNPEELLFHLESAVREYDDSITGLSDASLRITGHDREIPVRDIRAREVNQLISVEGIVSKATEVKPKLRLAVFQCTACGELYERIQMDEELESPSGCEDCGAGIKSLEVQLRRSEMIDFQKVQVQEPPEDIDGGDNPQSIDVTILGDATGAVTPGDRVTATGILRGKLVQAGNRGEKSVMSTHLQGVSIEQEEQDFDELVITDEDVEKIQALASESNIYEQLASSIAPSIFGFEKEKEAMVLQLFSGVPKSVDDGNSRIRGDLHMLFVGDPGTGKSQLIRYVKQLSPRGVFTSGKGTSSAGITAAAVRDSEFGGDDKWTLQAGALVLADKGVACVDELDKMRSQDRSALHEALEQQSYASDTEVLLSNGDRREMGPLVDELMADAEEDVVDAVNCEILDLDERDVRLHTVELDDGTHTKIDVDRVSRHESPDQMVTLSFSNGREITVTPDHPLYTTENAEISVMDAIDAEVGDFVPAARELPNSSRAVDLETNTAGRTPGITLPRTLSKDAAELLGHLTADGNSYTEASEHVVGYTNDSQSRRNRFRELVQSLFGQTAPINYNARSRSAPTLRISSKRIYRWFEQNHPEVLRGAGEKRIPASVLGASSEHIRRFLVGAFAGDGGVKSTSMGIGTKSRGLAEDYADAMLKIGVASRITTDESKETKYYKTTVKGDCNLSFTEQVVSPAEKSVEKANALSFDDSGKHHDVLPTDFVTVIRELKQRVGMRLTGKFTANVANESGIQMSTAREEIDAIESHVKPAIEHIETARSIREVRDIVGLSQDTISSLTPLTTSSINYAEQGGYNAAKRRTMQNTVVEAVQSEFEAVLRTTTRIRELMSLRYERITDIERSEPKSEWVYDLTVEPTRTFLSKGLVLHNTISVNKAGINATLKSRCSLLAAANPEEGRFDEYYSVPEQINLEPPLISRFDLMFIVKDKPEKKKDEDIARHIIKTNRAGQRNARDENLDGDFDELDNTQTEEVKQTIESSTFRKYVAHARKTCYPELTDEAENAIVDFYVSLRKSGAERDAISITARKLESLIRLAEASARVRLSDTVEPRDASRAIDLAKHSLRQVGTDPDTGEFDIDMVEAGSSTSQRKRKKGVKAIIKEICAERKDAGEKPHAERDAILDRAANGGLGRDKAEKELTKMVGAGHIAQPKTDCYYVVD